MMELFLGMTAMIMIAVIVTVLLLFKIKSISDNIKDILEIQYTLLEYNDQRQHLLFINNLKFMINECIKYEDYELANYYKNKLEEELNRHREFYK